MNHKKKEDVVIAFEKSFIYKLYLNLYKVLLSFYESDLMGKINL